MSKKRKIIFWIAIIVLALCVGYLVYYFVGKQERSKVYNDIKEQAVTKDEPSVKEEPVKEGTTAEIPVDFATLQAQYPDLYAWIEIPGIEELSYPIVQSLTDDTYYLDYTIDGVYGYPGSIYTESANAKDLCICRRVSDHMQTQRISQILIQLYMDTICWMVRCLEV